jgi:hypothetical protein
VVEHRAAAKALATRLASVAHLTGEISIQTCVGRHLGESGDLENTADSVTGLYRDEVDHPNSPERGLAELSVLKKRQLGEEVGTVRSLVWLGESYRDYARQRA